MADNSWGWRDDLKSFLRWQPFQAIWDWFWGTAVGKAVVGLTMAAVAALVGYFGRPVLVHGAVGAVLAMAFVIILSIISSRFAEKSMAADSPLILENGVLKWRTLSLKQIANRHFVNETVPLDGVEYMNCVFEHCTVSYQGTSPVRLTDCQLIRHEGQTNLTITSSNPIVMAAFSIQLGIQSVPPIRPLGWKFEPGD